MVCQCDDGEMVGMRGGMKFDVILEFLVLNLNVVKTGPRDNKSPYFTIV